MENETPQEIKIIMWIKTIAWSRSREVELHDAGIPSTDNRTLVCVKPLKTTIKPPMDSSVGCLGFDSQDFSFHPFWERSHKHKPNVLQALSEEKKNLTAFGFPEPTVSASDGLPKAHTDNRMYIESCRAHSYENSFYTTWLFTLLCLHTFQQQFLSVQQEANYYQAKYQLITRGKQSPVLPTVTTMSLSERNIVTEMKEFLLGHINTAAKKGCSSLPLHDRKL